MITLAIDRESRSRSRPAACDSTIVDEAPAGLRRLLERGTIGVAWLQQTGYLERQKL